MTQISDKLREMNHSFGFGDKEETWLTAGAKKIESLEAEVHRLRSAIWVYLARSDDNPLLPKYSRMKADEIAHEIITGGRQGFARRAALGEGKE